MAANPAHLIERAAQQLRGVGGLSTAPVPADLPPSSPIADEAAAGDATEIIRDDVGVRPESAKSEKDIADRIDALAAAARRPPSRMPERGLAQPEIPAGPVLSLEQLEAAGMVVGRRSRTRVAEEFRVTVGEMLRGMKGTHAPGRGGGNLLLVTSARPGEGKSFTALNLAGSIAQHTQREVLLVDVDAKDRSLSDHLGLSAKPGLLDLVADPALRVEACVLRTCFANLAVLPIGVRHKNDGGETAVAAARPISAMVERLGRRFPNHVIILDSPPCLSASDPSTLAPVVGQVLMVVEAEKSQRAEVLAALDLVKACPNVTLLLNKTKLTTSYTFGAYHYFGTYS